MKTYARYTLDICPDCLYMAANGWNEQWTGRPVPDPVPLGHVPASALIGSASNDDPFFSWSACEGCGDVLGGDRYTVDVVETSPEGE